MGNHHNPVDLFWVVLADPDVDDEWFLAMAPEPGTVAEIRALCQYRPQLIRRMIEDPLGSQPSPALQLAIQNEDAPIHHQLYQQLKSLRQLPRPRPS